MRGYLGCLGLRLVVGGWVGARRQGRHSNGKHSMMKGSGALSWSWLDFLVAQAPARSMAFEAHLRAPTSWGRDRPRPVGSGDS
ncbi:hypothetical protein B0T19DRAFT_435429 [Cercophora scortea]|uniref:Uncharacterized protein n=1 Tax=Cercophora scortea TaxID=314031 RepID=A0AAE0I359_9PEZI|nr:hypothetical protein B0T19DRAFT_435429 [Cercophora scortea]